MYLKIQEKLVFSDLFSDGKPAEISRDFEPTASFILFTCVVLHKPRFGAGQLVIRRSRPEIRRTIKCASRRVIVHIFNKTRIITHLIVRIISDSAVLLFV